MLDKNSLSALKQLKSSIQSQKEYAEGVVAGTSGRFGFVRLDDGRDAFLAPDKMQRVLPGDRVRVSITTNDKDKLDADLEKLVDSPTDRFVGTYRVKGTAHFVAPDLPQMQRWLFIPPKSRGKAEDGDLVVAKVARHPFDDGKGSARLLELVGKPNDNKIEHRYITAKFNMSRHWSGEADKQVQAMRDLSFEAGDTRADMTSTPFVTIDAESTRDMDDAITIETRDEGWSLKVAIADPASYITSESALAKAAMQHAQTTYLPGGSLGMLPAELAYDVFSLREKEPRPALICSVAVAPDGSIEQYAFSHALIASHARLNYNQVASLLDGDEEAVPADLRVTLHELNKLAAARLQYRTQNALVGDDQPDYDFVLDERGRIADIIKREKTLAHRLVEEAMLAVNVCAGEFLAQHEQGLFATHVGFREERIGEVRALLQEEMPELDTDNINELTGHLALLKLLRKSESHAPLLAPLKRMMRSGELSHSARPHLGLGIAHYATVTSPIRRFADLYNHWAIRHVLYGDSHTPLDETQVEQLQEFLITGRRANRQLEQWLVCQYLQSKIGETARARIRIVTQQGFGARIESNGIDGFVNFDKKQPKTFDAKRMTLAVGGRTFRLDEPVDIRIAGVDMERRRVKFEVVDARPADNDEESPSQKTPQ